ncbi:MAG: antirestriction protein ArdA [Mycobacteriales bacterium]
METPQHQGQERNEGPEHTGPPEEVTEQEPGLQPQIWVGCLRDYNDGLLHGAWLDADQEPEALQAATEALLARSPRGPGAEEWAIFDHQDFAGINLGEYASFDTVSRLARGLVEHGPPFGAWVGAQGEDPETAARFEEAFLGHWSSLGDYAEQLLEDLGLEELLDRAIPGNLRPYVHIDADSLGRDLQLGGDIVVCQSPDGGVWIFDATV